MRRTTFVGLAALLLASCHASKPQIEVEDAWARQSMAGQSRSAAYFTIRNSGGGDRLLSVSAAVGKASLHSTSMDNGIIACGPSTRWTCPRIRRWS